MVKLASIDDQDPDPLGVQEAQARGWIVAGQTMVRLFHRSSHSYFTGTALASSLRVGM